MKRLQRMTGREHVNRITRFRAAEHLCRCFVRNINAKRPEIFAMILLVCAALLSGCDVIVEAAQASPYEELYDFSDSDSTNQTEFLPLMGGQMSPEKRLGRPAVTYDTNPGGIYPRTITYRDIITQGILYSVQNKPAVDLPLTLSPDEWMQFPVVPSVSDTARAIYLRGLALGNNPHAFSKVGDCQNVPTLFLGTFDDNQTYRLGVEYAYLQETIDWFEKSFERESLAVRGGFNAASVLSPMWADPEWCERDETPLECEYRIHNPSFAVISLETWWEKSPESYEMYLQEILEITIGRGIVPILSTKGDNLEGDHAINATLVRLAVEYDIPIWNFWKAIQPLPDHGLHQDGFHLTFAQNYFDDPLRMKSAWPWRNLTALQALNWVRYEVGAVEP